MSNEKPEEIVKKKCIQRLSQWESDGIVVDVDDVSNLGRGSHRGRFFMNTKAGKRDIIAWFKVGSVLWTYLVVCKAPDGGKWSDKQKEYAKKFEGLDNCIYEVVSDDKQIDRTLERITNRSELLLKEIDRIMMPEKNWNLYQDCERQPTTS